MRSWLATALLCVVVLSGCLSPPDGGGPPEGVTSGDWPFAFDATCDDATISFLDDLDRLQGLLPPGFTAADAAGFLLNAPAPSGSGLIAITTADCTESSMEEGALSEAEVAILVEPPRLDGAEVETGAVATTYLAALYVSSEAYHARIAPWGHDMEVASVSNQVPDPSWSGPMTITIADGEGEVAHFEALLPALRPEEAGFTNNWQATGAGLLHYRIDLAAREFGTGTSVACTIREGSTMHALFGFTDCAGQTAHAIGETGDPYRSAWTFFPDAKAGAS